MKHSFVLPPLDGPPTGGTLYNRNLVSALRRAGDEVTVATSFEVATFGRAPTSSPTWIDTLFIESAAGWPDRGRLGLLTHYLPALVEHGPAPGVGALSDNERVVLRRAEFFVAPSHYLRSELESLGVTRERICVVEPGTAPEATPRVPGSSRPVKICVVANLTPGKGVAELLEQLGKLQTAGYRVDVVGSEDMDPAYALRCHHAARAGGVPVRFLGSCAASRCLEIVRQSDVLVSASRMESYGMAIADAQACGVPVVAVDAGNVRWLVTEARGGTLVGDVAGAAAAVVELVRTPAELRARQDRAGRNLRQRVWALVAAEFRAFARRVSAQG